MRRRRGLAAAGGPYGVRRNLPPPHEGIVRGDVVMLLAAAVFLLAAVAGYAWAADLQLRGGLLHQYAQASTRPDWVSLERLPPHVPAAFLNVVDPEFRDREVTRHRGDRRTMSRDLVRQVHRLPPGMDGRARVLVMAPLVEHRLGPDRLLEFYVNRVDLGRDGEWAIHGIGAAAREYFHKPAEELTLGEAATLAALLLPPRLAEPAAVPGAVAVRRREVLDGMRRAGSISDAQYRAALGEPLAFQPAVVDAPMTRPPRWRPEPPLLRLPPELRPAADTAAARAAS